MSNPRLAILLLTEARRKAVTTCRKTRALEHAQASREVVRHAAAMRDLGVPLDAVVEGIVGEAMQMMIGSDEDGLFVTPERHELTRDVRELLASLSG